MDGSSLNIGTSTEVEGSQPPFKRKDVCFLMDDLSLLEKKEIGNLVDTNMSPTSHETVFFLDFQFVFCSALGANCGGTLPPNRS